ncbi:YojF family protein [Paenibacillus spongiae]|uniref:YojF family protein n=2 Tax=Paenibacillus spongiae TaxID=2909671 RepID=A0ABY5SE64_9BACL|nr:YojF family protein [Paenibacillus spongiae]UVI31015.1 YojF family protein [Paenibacillus spongiae]
MIKITKPQVEAELQTFLGAEAYIHSEATSFVFVRNFKVRVTDVFIAGEGPFRAALRFDGHGWLRMEALTHYEADGSGRLLLAGYDDRGRMNVALHLGKEPFPE